METYKSETGQFINADCLDAMKGIPDGSIDMVLCDLPYGTTICKWDTIIPFKPLWEQYWRICKLNGAVVLTASQPFTSRLVVSNIDKFKYEIIWEKDKPSDFATSSFRTMKYHESILVFCQKKETYNPQMVAGAPNHSVGRGIRIRKNETSGNTSVVFNKTNGLKHPKSVIKYNREPKPIHPTQKPIALFEYLIKTYTNEGDTVLDNCAGSGTTAIAAINTNRKWICIEKDAEYSRLAVERIKAHQKPVDLFT